MHSKRMVCVCYARGSLYNWMIVYAEAINLKTTDGRTYPNPRIAGNESQSGYVEGVQRAARFRQIHSCLHLNKTSLLVVDSGNHCLRLVDRISHQTSQFAESCTQAGYKDGNDPLFNYPWKAILNSMNNDQLLLLDTSNHAMRAINILVCALGVTSCTCSCSLSYSDF